MLSVKKEESCHGDNGAFLFLMAEYVVFMHYDINESNLSVLSLCGHPFRDIDNDRKNLYISLVSDGFFFNWVKYYIIASSDMLI